MLEFLATLISAAVGVGTFAGMTRARLKSIDGSLTRIDRHLENQNGTLVSHACRLSVLESHVQISPPTSPPSCPAGPQEPKRTS